MPTAKQHIGKFLNDHLSVSMFANGATIWDGTTDARAAFVAALGELSSGGRLYVPRGTYSISEYISVPSNVEIFGDGAASVLKRGGSIEAGKGLFDITGTDIAFRNFLVDGDVTSSTGINYTGLTDPMDSRLTGNSSFWAHGGAKRIKWEGVTVQHTGGYSILLDATSTGDIEEIRILACKYLNNRPHLFGTDNAHLEYGSWSGGVHYQGDGTTYAVRDLLVQGCTFRRNTGNCLWGHLYAFGKIHRDVRIVNNYFEDCGLDGILVGGVIGGSVEGNRFRRVGYICTDDSSASVPKYLGSAYAVALDTSGLVRGVNYIGNSVISANGAAFDCDGFCEGVIADNTAVIPRSGEPEYTEDSIATIGPNNDGQNLTYGIQTSNTNNIALPGSNVLVKGNTLINLGGGGIRMYAARNCHVIGNTIEHPAGSAYPPIGLGNIGTGNYQRAQGTVVSENRINWSPVTEQAAIIEDAGYGDFQATDKNWVVGNRLTGTCFEFRKHATSGSSTKLVMSGASDGLTQRSEIWLQSEGVGSAAQLCARKTDASLGPMCVSALGVGTANPDSLVHLLSPVGADIGIKVERATVATALYASNYFGTFSNSEMSLYTNSLQRITVTAGGNVGIGLAPTHLLHVAGDIYVNSDKVVTYYGGTNLLIPGAITSQATGTSIAFQTANYNFQVDGNGNVSLAGSLMVNTVQRISSAGAGVFSSLSVGSNAVVTFYGGSNLLIPGAITSQATGTDISFQTANYNFQVDGGGNLSVATAIMVGGVKMIASDGTGQLQGTWATQAWVTDGFVPWYGDNNIDIGGCFNSQATGSDIAFQTSNYNFQVDGAGNLSVANAIMVNNVAMITAAGDGLLQTSFATQAWVNSQGFLTSSSLSGYATESWVNSGFVPWYSGDSINIGGCYNSQATGTDIAFQTSNYKFQVDGNGNLSVSTAIMVNSIWVIDTDGYFIGTGVSVPSGWVKTGDLYVDRSGTVYTGQDWEISASGGITFAVNGSGTYSKLTFKAGVLVGT